MKNTLLLIFLLSIISVNAQLSLKTNYYPNKQKESEGNIDENDWKQSIWKYWTEYGLLYKTSTFLNDTLFGEEAVYISGKLLQKDYYTNGIRDSLYSFDIFGILSVKSYFNSGKAIKSLLYDSIGNLKQMNEFVNLENIEFISSFYKGDKIIKTDTVYKNKNPKIKPIFEAEVVDDDDVFEKVEEAPEFPGGLSALYTFLAKNMKYPAEAREKNIQGKVYVSFIIEKDGSVSNVTLIRGIGGGCDEEAIRVVQMLPKWIPGKTRGNPIKVLYKMPVSFRLG